jgi:3-hydroxymyristoyl/3-hydroxydecanoyl-(acyl carrier protein) dehydratase
MDEAALEQALDIDAHHPAFAGHFPGTPVLPGVVLLDEALHVVRESGALADGAFRIGSAKFFHPVLPGTSLLIRHRRLASGSVEFEIVAGTTRVASGTFLPGVEPA